MPEIIQRFAVMLASGWYLLYAPNNQYALPLKLWEHIASFDTAKECEQFKNTLLTKQARDLPLQSRALRCISADQFPH